MKICIISGEFPPMQGGVGDYTHEMAHAYSQLGHQVTVITATEGVGKPGDADEFTVRPIIESGIDRAAPRSRKQSKHPSRMWSTSSIRPRHTA